MAIIDTGLTVFLLRHVAQALPLGNVEGPGCEYEVAIRGIREYEIWSFFRYLSALYQGGGP